MKTDKVIYWSITAIISFFMLFSAYVSGTNEVEFRKLGFPEYFRIELTAAKIIGAIALLIPQVPARIREWIYVSFSIVLVSACIAKLNSGYPMLGAIEPLIVLTIMVGLLFYLNRRSGVARSTVHAKA
ncbi:MAG: DoxX family protein [Roseimicrobium sp.]